MINCKWIFKKKESIQGVEPDRFKARLVARGCTQKEEIDFNEAEMAYKTKPNMVQSSTNQSKETGFEKLNFEVETEDKHAETQVVNWPFGEEKSEEEEQEEVGYVLARDRTRMEIEQPKRYEYDDIIAFALVAASEVLEEDPKTIKAFLASKEKEKWLSAMNEEIKSH